MGLVGGRTIPWTDFWGLFLFLAGLILGLGGVTVIDFHAFFGRKSEYWTEATTRTHKITKPLIWLGFLMAVAGGFVLHRESGFTGVALFQAAIAAILFINALYLTLRVSPMLLRKERRGRAQALLSRRQQRPIFLSFFISFFGWWSEALLFVWYLLMMR
jgi:hypothetical protein